MINDTCGSYSFYQEAGKFKKFFTTYSTTNKEGVNRYEDEPYLIERLCSTVDILKE